jgi:hypothetical protein
MSTNARNRRCPARHERRSVDEVVENLPVVSRKCGPLACALQELHRNKLLAVLLPDIVNGADVRVVQSGSGFGLTTKSLQGLTVLRYVFGQEFESDKEAYVLRFIHYAHSATTELLRMR